MYEGFLLKTGLLSEPTASIGGGKSLEGFKLGEGRLKGHMYDAHLDLSGTASLQILTDLLPFLV